MKKLEEIQIEYAKSIGFSDWFDLLKHQLNNGLIYRDYNEVAKRYAKQACENLRERIVKEVYFTVTDVRGKLISKGQRGWIDNDGNHCEISKEGILNTEIILP